MNLGQRQIDWGADRTTNPPRMSQLLSVSDVIFIGALNGGLKGEILIFREVLIAIERRKVLQITIDITRTLKNTLIRVLV